MAQIGEFSFVIATLVLSLGVISPFIYPIAVAVSVLCMAASPYLTRSAGGLANGLRRVTPRSVQLLASSYSGWLENLKPVNENAAIAAIFRRLLWHIAINILLVVTFFHFYLRDPDSLNGLSYWCNLVLHYLAPLIYVVWWLVGVRHGPLVVRRVPIMLVPTFVYFLIAMARGGWTHEYPYPILNVVKLGYGHVLLNAVAMTLALGCLIGEPPPDGESTATLPDGEGGEPGPTGGDLN